MDWLELARSEENKVTENMFQSDSDEEISSDSDEEIAISSATSTTCSNTTGSTTFGPIVYRLLPTEDVIIPEEQSNWLESILHLLKLNDFEDIVQKIHRSKLLWSEVEKERF